MAMTNRNNAKLDCMIYYTLDELVPQEHLVRKLDNCIDFTFIEELLKDEKDPILLCYEKEGQFCHRHVLAEFINLKYGIYVPDISIGNDLEIVEHKKPEYIKRILQEIIKKEVER